MRSQMCASCGHFFEVEERFAGGIVNCPACGRATEVAGLRDPLWKGLVIAAVVGWIGASAFVVSTWGLIPGLAAAAALGIFLWLVSRAF
jgi:hypothetical protein